MDATLYHGSCCAIRAAFRPFTHFGTRRAALERAVVVARRTKRRHGSRASIFLYPVRIRVQSPLRISDLSGEIKVHSPVTLADLLYYEMEQAISAADRDRIIGAGDGGFVVLAQALQERGFDGLVYRNEHEDAGSDSWIILSPEQAKAERPARLLLSEAAAEVGCEI